MDCQHSSERTKKEIKLNERGQQVETNSLGSRKEQRKREKTKKTAEDSKEKD
jgi:hypothetical protein